MLTLLAATAMLLTTPSKRLESLATKLESLHSVKFVYTRTLDYPADKFHHVLKAQMNIEWGRKNNLCAVFVATAETWTLKYDGDALSLSNKDGDGDRSKLNPTEGDFRSESVLKNSLLGLASGVRGFLKDDKARLATVSETDDAWTVRMGGLNAELQPTPGLESVGYDPEYEITVDKKSGLPTAILQRLKNREDTIRTEFSDWDVSIR